MSAAKSLAIKRDPNDPETRRNAAIAAAIVIGVLLLLVVHKAVQRGKTRAVEVAVRGYKETPIKAKIEFLAVADRKLVLEGEALEPSGLFAGRVPAGAYVVEATVMVKETDVGLPNAYPSQQTVVVPEDAAVPVRIEFSFPGIEPYLEYPGRYKVHK